jgi:glycosyltransferase involved in cell wall biosynthesis
LKYLFVHQNFPGQFLHLVMRLRQDPGNELVFISEPNENHIAGCRKIVYRKPEFNENTYHDAMEFEVALKRAHIVQQMAEQIRGLGFTPDIIIGHHGWGELLNLNDVWPGVPLLGYHEFYYHTEGLDVGFDPEFPSPPGGVSRVRSKNAINLLALTNPGHGQTPTQFQLSTYPEWSRNNITMLPEGVDLNLCRPNPAARKSVLDVNGFTVEPSDILITYVSRDLEPYRGFHTMMRALPRLHRLGGNVKVVMVGGDGVSYGARLPGATWRQKMMEEVGALIDPSRVCFPGKVSYELFLKLLQRSDAHVYLTYPFVLSWSLREAMACGCALVASDTAPVREFVTHRKTGLLTAFPDPSALVAAVQEVIEDKALAARLRRNARSFAEKTLSMDVYLDAYEALIQRVVAGTA